MPTMENNQHTINDSVSILNELALCDSIPLEYREDSYNAVRYDKLLAKFKAGKEFYLDSTLEDGLIGAITYLNEGHKDVITDALHIGIKQSKPSAAVTFELLLDRTYYTSTNLEELELKLFEYALEEGYLS